MHKIYNLNEGVQVRNEKFGLLFYNYRGPRLYFVPTADLVDAGFFDGKSTAGELIESVCGNHSWPRRQVEAQVSKVLTTLEERGLINGQSLC